MSSSLIPEGGDGLVTLISFSFFPPRSKLLLILVLSYTFSVFVKVCSENHLYVSKSGEELVKNVGSWSLLWTCWFRILDTADGISILNGFSRWFLNTLKLAVC